MTDLETMASVAHSCSNEPKTVRQKLSPQRKDETRVEEVESRERIELRGATSNECCESGGRVAAADDGDDRRGVTTKPATVARA